MWVTGIRTQVLVLSQWAPYAQSHLPSHPHHFSKVRSMVPQDSNQEMDQGSVLFRVWLSSTDLPTLIRTGNMQFLCPQDAWNLPFPKLITERDSKQGEQDTLRQSHERYPIAFDMSPPIQSRLGKCPYLEGLYTWAW